jgi:hypothetical protein
MTRLTAIALAMLVPTGAAEQTGNIEVVQVRKAQRR